MRGEAYLVNPTQTKRLRSLRDSEPIVLGSLLLVLRYSLAVEAAEGEIDLSVNIAQIGSEFKVAIEWKERMSSKLALVKA